MIRSKGGTVIGGAFWTPGATIIGGTSKKTFDQIIKSLFANSEQGFAYDPNDLTTMFQDAAGTVPVTDVGQPVGLIRDKSGRNNHAFQTTSASRPILQRNATTGAYYLEFDGVDDFLQTNSIDFTATDKLSIFAAVKKNVDGVYGIIVEQDANTDIDGYFVLATSSAEGYYLQNGNIGNRSGFTMSGGASAPRSDVVVVSLDRSKADSTALRYSIESTELISTGVDIVGAGASGNFGNAPLFIGRRNGTTVPFNGRLYGLIICAALTPNEEVKAIKREMAKTIGV